MELIEPTINIYAWRITALPDLLKIAIDKEKGSRCEMEFWAITYIVWCHNGQRILFGKGLNSDFRPVTLFCPQVHLILLCGSRLRCLLTKNTTNRRWNEQNMFFWNAKFR